MTINPKRPVKSKELAVVSLIALVVLPYLQGLDFYYDYLKTFMVK